MRNLRIIRKRRIAFLLSSLCCVCAFFGADLSGAWFVTGGTFGSMTVENAEVRYLPTMENETPDIHGKLIDGSGTNGGQTVYLIPGSGLLEADPGQLLLQNFSTVPTEVRVVVNCLLSTDGTEATEVGGMRWQRIGETNSYYYGKNDAAGRFMPMLEFAFASDAGYSWAFTEGGTAPDGMVDFSTCWELRVAGSPTVPVPDTPVAGTTYHVLNALTLVAEYTHDDAGNDTLDVTQAEFDTFFSENFAGNTMTLEILYYAKQQQYMNWNVFSRQFVTLAP